MRTVLFTCVHNAARSQMAAAFFNQLADPDKAQAISAGSQPDDSIDPAVVTVMREVGIDLSQERPQQLTAKLQAQADFLVTLGCGEVCPQIPPFRRSDWGLDDPRGQQLDRVRQIRDEIRGRVVELLAAREWGR